MIWIAAAAVLLLAAAIFLTGQHTGQLVLEDARTNQQYACYRLAPGQQFSVGFVHSVNKSPVVDTYQVEPDGIYVINTVYYGFGAGVQTELGEGQTLSYGEDGSMIISGFDQKIEPLVYTVGTVSDHILSLKDQQISLRDLCGRNAMVRFRYTCGWW